MLTQKRIVPQLVEQYNDLIEQNLIQSNFNDLTDNQNNSFVLSDDKLIHSNQQINNDFVLNDENVLKDEEKESEKSIVFQESIPQNKEVLVEVSEKNEVLNEEKVITNEKNSKSDANVSKALTQIEDESETIPVIIKLNPILESLMHRRKHCFVTKTIVPKEICGICSESIKFSEKYIQCINCIAITHLNCTSELALPCIPYTNPNLKPSKVISNYVYPAFKPSVPAILIHCCREIEERSHESYSNGLYVMKSEGFQQVKELCDKILKSKSGFPLLKHFKIDLICGVVKKFLSDFNESLIGRDLWKQFSFNMRKKDDEEIKSLAKQLVMELNITNRDTLSFLILHLKHLAHYQKSLSLEHFSEIFCPIICGDSEVTRKLRLMSTLLNLNHEFWAKFF